MMHAYDKLYLEKARAALARMLDFAVYDLHQDLTSFFDLFISSGVAQLFEQGDIHTLVGMSGVELAYEVLDRSCLPYKRITPQYTMDRSAEYWTGWALAYYQWDTAQPFAEIIQYVPIRNILAMYDPYHEMDIRQFCDALNERMRSAKPDTNLKLIRQKNGLTQNELAEISGVPLRTIQQYEQRQKSINKAQAEYLDMLSTALNCSIEQLIERI